MCVYVCKKEGREGWKDGIWFIHMDIISSKSVMAVQHEASLGRG